MRFLTSLNSQLIVAIAGFGLMLIAAPQKSLAQESINIQNYESPNSSDPFSRGVEQDSFGGMWQLIHNATLGNMNSNFQPEEGITDAVSAFRKRQADAFKQRQNSNIPNSNTTNNTTNNSITSEQ